ncbi:hypothetical protein DPMN_145161 [Dreissena polymorpha]|uniref:Uncharacterized protein n=1 Tax=Dreissena polymorpha TaxID=45954 RepID=A0A9D4F9C0_DREPO|nr:hypothetical protein DPMN_145161 [Dreissena polymorpha]
MVSESYNQYVMSKNVSRLLASTGSRGDATDVDNGKSSEMAESRTSHHCKSYLLSMVHKLRTNTEVQFGTAFTAFMEFYFKGSLFFMKIQSRQRVSSLINPVKAKSVILDKSSQDRECHP